MEKKTIEEAAEKLYREFPNNPLDKPEFTYNRDINCFRKRKAFIAGAEWYAKNQSEQMYSEEEVKQMLFGLGDVLFNNCPNGIKEGEPEKYFDEIINQFKKK